MKDLRAQGQQGISRDFTIIHAFSKPATMDGLVAKVQDAFFTVQAACCNTMKRPIKVKVKYSNACPCLCEHYQELERQICKNFTSCDVKLCPEMPYWNIGCVPFEVITISFSKKVVFFIHPMNDVTNTTVKFKLVMQSYGLDLRFTVISRSTLR